MNSDKRLINIFRTFVNTVLLPTFKTNEPVSQEWNYFSTIISSDVIDYKMLDVYIDVLVQSGPQTFYRNNGNALNQKINNNLFKLDMDRSKTNSMLYPQKIENQSYSYDSGFQLNKTVGASERSKITAMFPTKPSNPSFTFETGSNKLISKTSIKGVEEPSSILSDMERIYKTLSQNQLKLEGNSLQINSGGGSYYKFKEDRRP